MSAVRPLMQRSVSGAPAIDLVPAELLSLSADSATGRRGLPEVIR